MADGRTNWLILGVMGVLVVNFINISIAMMYGIIESGYGNVVILISMLLTSALLATTWGLYSRAKARVAPSPTSGDSVESREIDQSSVDDSLDQDDGTIIIPFDTAEKDGEDIPGYGRVPYSTKTSTGDIRCKRCLLTNPASREGQTCTHCGTYLLLLR
jgi:hypothetical protein